MLHALNERLRRSQDEAKLLGDSNRELKEMIEKDSEYTDLIGKSTLDSQVCEVTYL